MSARPSRSKRSCPGLFSAPPQTESSWLGGLHNRLFILVPEGILLADPILRIGACQDPFPVDASCELLAVLLQPLDAADVVQCHIFREVQVAPVEKDLREVAVNDFGLLLAGRAEQFLESPLEPLDQVARTLWPYEAPGPE